MKSVVVLGLLLSLCPSVWAASSAFKISPATDQTQRGQILLRLGVQDSQPKSGVCPYYVKSFQFLEAVQILNVEVYQQNCVNDAFGISSGEVDWVVPTSLLSNNTELKVLVNQNAAGILVYDENSKSFHLKN